MLVGFSRKSSLGKLIGVRDRDGARRRSARRSRAYERGATILRVHDVREHVEALAAARGGVRDEVELRGLEVFGYHGVEEEERRIGQPFLFDVELEVGERGANDRLEEAVDYTRGRRCDP